MHVTLRQLHVFEAVARHLSYTRAAEELHLSQPAVSMQIKQLEGNVGLALFEQLGKKIFLTEAGRELYHYSQQISRELSEAEDVLEELKGSRRGTLTIAVASTATYFALHLLGRFHQRFPEANISLDVTNRKSLLRHLEENTIDMAIMGKPPEGLEVVAKPFMENPLVVIAPPAHPLAGQRVPLTVLRQETFILREHGSGTRIAMERFFARLGATITSSMEISSNEAIKQAVQAGFGLGIVSQHTLEKELALRRLVILEVDSFPIMRHWYIVYRKNKRATALHKAFKKLVFEEAREQSITFN
ncbi:transcriptional regulator, LysR family [Nitrosococcus oceani ATCC 19707]|uniref:Transcriptional regulator, LysR family n=2 Tax=Nitrosococcus oceani TaxID=1229 RepID=Q3JE86_NITOC|nr:LysR family transcriptional regulator [Nitrosococcus oceani]ABA56860.1 transcriptional regulator, LysR family [Nitrosococcus oceani ATCC 19707]EDZ66583.1 LysR substrate binding domain protein [Nitrosococcus oceani AFC27]KFI20702.1 transcriptional regulator [Nitrosococcus oceani C-27]GEM21709.1 LysR family transcriptional regulator [Nitrosococcus oceani]